MKNVDLSKLMTLAEARAALGCGHRAIYRIIDRVGRENVVVELLGRTLIRKDALESLKAHYYPYYSEAHQSMVKEWGRRGGTQKAVNARQGGRRRAGGSGKNDAQA
jgi:hypothetical protein